MEGVVALAIGVDSAFVDAFVEEEEEEVEGVEAVVEVVVGSGLRQGIAVSAIEVVIEDKGGVAGVGS